MHDLTTGNIYKKFILFGLPMVLSGLLSQAYGIVDTVIAGQFLGEAGLAAVGATAQVISLISAFFYGFYSGFSIYIARLFGSKDYEKLKSDTCNVFLALALFAAGFCAVVILFSGEILDMIRVDPAVRKEAQTYFCIYTMGLFIIVFDNGFSKYLNALGISSFPFYMSVIAGVLNIAGNILSVTVLGLGVAGIALSSVFAALVVDILYLFKINRCFKEMGLQKQKLRFSIQPFRTVVKFSLPNSLQQISMYIAAAVMAPIVNGIGSDATAGYTVVMRIYNINASVYQCSSITLSSYAAQCVGSEKYGRIKKGLFVGMLQGVLFTLPFILACSVWAQPINAVFFPAGFTGNALAYAVRFSRLYLPFILFNFINNLFHSFFRGIGAMRLLLVSTVLGSVARIVAGVLLGNMYGMEGIYLGWVLSWVAEALFMLLVYVWKFNTAPKIEREAKRNFAH